MGDGVVVIEGKREGGDLCRGSGGLEGGSRYVQMVVCDIYRLFETCGKKEDVHVLYISNGAVRVLLLLIS